MSAILNDIVEQIPGLIATIIVFCLFGYMLFRQSKSTKKDDSCPWEIPAENAPFAFERIQKLKIRDPHFDEASFLGFTRIVFNRLQLAIKKRDIRVVGAFLSPQQHNIISNSIHYQDSTYPSLALINLLRNNIYDVSLDGSIESISVAMIFSNNDQLTREKWTFIRSTNVKTLVDKGVTVDKCPSCGAPLSVNASGECDYCHSNITKGDFDWVLSEISQLN